MEMFEKNEEGVGEEEAEEEEEEDLVFEVDIAGDGDCFYSSIVEAFSRSSTDLSDEVFLTKFSDKMLDIADKRDQCGAFEALHCQLTKSEWGEVFEALRRQSCHSRVL